LSDQGFGIITEIDLAATLREKLGAQLEPQVILGACRPVLAYEAIQADPSIATMLPCNVVVRALDEVTTSVQAFDPRAMSRIVQSSALEPVASDAHRRLAATLDSLTEED
jgi:uncharacterized protein (DUF302 family)